MQSVCGWVTRSNGLKIVVAAEIGSLRLVYGSPTSELVDTFLALSAKIATLTCQNVNTKSSAFSFDKKQFIS